ncbi:MAG: bifunctional (p)ppGpp synthetase/guanosine-3',5'-bis(diphosphate) 3'-pyrophosphohydrolase [Oligoflexia bacterium]|nr:bifunctional (p)ppGpp synthetase/guanosine-3',5'-bis(diphosphate) 3'-pyrophosphohydrolase [Oligoflexia bacterium]MBF0364632.1 bifunctional (p)ppGpp synthetase/guanosine-3',5'-bis(diphosphate) 3'-pyrophosphohydrolase [Oligoflexia bacterium]
MNLLNFAHESDLTTEILVKRLEIYYTDADFDTLRKACVFAESAHRGQKRSSGEDYFVHPMNVAATLIKLRMDLESIVAGLLHDVIEDCNVTSEELEKEFSPTIVQIVVGLTKISQIKFKSREEGQAENFRKMIVAMARDIRVIIVKLADRMHNMRTLQYISEEKQQNVAKETLEIYVPLAGRLGIHSVKAELEDLCLRFLHPESYYMLAERIAMKKSEREKYIHDVVSIIQDKLAEYAIEADVFGRPKNFYSIHKKIQQRGVEFEQIHDILAFRIITTNITQCYKALGVIHSSFTPIPGRFKDYIAIPKINNYQSLHTTVIGPKAERIEIQIRTFDMDEIAETGVAAHWVYKENGMGGSRKKNMEWMKELLEFNRSMKSNSEFMDAVKNDLDVGGVFVFTPDGDVREFSSGSTPLDFAYSIHTEVGNTCIGAKINGKIVPLKYRLKSGDVVEIMTNKTQTPSKDWLKIVRSSRAKTKIKQWLLKAEREEHKKLGEELLEKILRVYSTSLKQLKKNSELNEMLEFFHVKNEDELCIQIGSGKCTPKDMGNFFSRKEEQQQQASDFASKNLMEKEKQLEADLEKIQKDFTNVTKGPRKIQNGVGGGRSSAVIVENLDDVLIRLAKCCNPIPGDPIVGYITRGRGVTVHTDGCKKNVGSQESSRVISVRWNEYFSFKHPVTIKVLTLDRPGILAKISKTINNLGINIRAAMAKSQPDQKGHFIFEVEVKDYSELLKLMESIRSKEEVLNVSRV